MNNCVMDPLSCCIFEIWMLLKRKQESYFPLQSIFSPGFQAGISFGIIEACQKHRGLPWWRPAKCDLVFAFFICVFVYMYLHLLIYSLKQSWSVGTCLLQWVVLCWRLAQYNLVFVLVYLCIRICICSFAPSKILEVWGPASSSGVFSVGGQH